VEPALSISRSVRPLLEASARPGIGLGRGYVDVGGYVLALVPRGAPRLPNGIESDAPVAAGEHVLVGDGAVRTRYVMVTGGPEWEPVPRPRVFPRMTVEVRLDVERLAGRGSGLTPSGDDILIGYVAGLALFHGDRATARAIAAVARRRTTALSATLLRHAAEGELPEPAHAALERGDVAPLLSWGHSSGRSLLVGLAVAASDPEAHRREHSARDVARREAVSGRVM
jgi:hypothetical protein